MNLNERLEYEKNFIKTYPILTVGDELQDSIFEKIDFVFENYEKFSIVHLQEVFKKQKTLDYIYKKVEETKKEILISSSTTKDDYLFTHPLTNLFFWQDCFSRSKMNWDSQPTLYFTKEYYKETNKEIKGILSIRKQRPERDVLYSKIKEFDGIKRYASYPTPPEENDLIIQQHNDSPTWEDLISEYNKSYISFIIESYGGGLLNQISEKILIAFLTKTIPIVYAGVDYIKELTDMGFCVWNSEFGFDNGDGLEIDNEIKMNNFVNCINFYNKDTIDDIKNLYHNNIDKIQKNYELAKIVMENGSWWNNRIIPK